MTKSNIHENNNMKMTPKPLTPQEQDQTSISGHMPDPSSDDNVDEFTAEVGLYAEEVSNPSPVNIAEEVQEAEEAFRDKK